MNTQKRTRSWTLTYFITDKERDERWFKELSKSKGIRYFIVGLEICPTTQKQHFQGYIAFNNAKTFKQVKKWFKLDRIHLEQAKASDFSNKTYCSKEGNLILETGKPQEQGRRSDITRAIEILKKNQQMSMVLENVHNYQACKHAELYLKYKETKTIRPGLKVINIWGASGTGKTRHVYDKHPEVYRPVSYKWWDGYDGHKVVLLDDIRKDFCKFHQLLNLLDIYPVRVEHKGGSRQLQATTIYITSPRPYVEMWEGRTAESLDQLSRRITQTIHITEL